MLSAPYILTEQGSEILKCCEYQYLYFDMTDLGIKLLLTRICLHCSFVAVLLLQLDSTTAAVTHR